MATANDALGDDTDLERLMMEGPEDVLNSTVNTGPAMLVFSYVSRLYTFHLKLFSSIKLRIRPLKF